MTEEIEALLAKNLSASAFYAVTEMHYGRLEWLAEHIKRSNFQIDVQVAKKLLEMIEESDPSCHFRIATARRSDLAPRANDPILLDHRDASMAITIARLCGFKRGALKQACFNVGVKYGLSADHVARRVRPFRDMALAVVAEERMRAAYQNGEVVFLGRPKTP